MQLTSLKINKNELGVGMKEYIIQDMKRFCRKVRKYSLTFLAEDIQHKNLRQFITLKQCCQIVKDHCPLDENGDRVLDEDTYVDIVEKICKQIYQSALSKLAADDIIECAWDDKEDKMIFWIQEESGIRYIDLDPS